MGTPVAANILLGPMIVYRAPVGTTFPDETTVDVGEAWPAPWERFGYTKAPLSWLLDRTSATVDVEEELSPIDEYITMEVGTAETVLAEITAQYLQLAIGGTLTTTPAGAGQVAYEQLDFGGTSVLPKFAWGFEGTNITAAGLQLPARWFFHRGTAKINGALEFSQKSGEYPGIALQIKTLADTNKPRGQKLGVFQRVTAAATS